MLVVYSVILVRKKSNCLNRPLLTSKRENTCKAFPPPSPPCNVVPLFEIPIENNKHPNFEWRVGKRGMDSFVP